MNKNNNNDDFENNEFFSSGSDEDNTETGDDFNISNDNSDDTPDDDFEDSSENDFDDFDDDFTDDFDDDFDNDFYNEQSSFVSPSKDSESITVKRSKRANKEKNPKTNSRVFFKKLLKPAIITVIILICAAAALFLYALSTISDNTIMKNVYIDNLYVGELSYDNALSAIENDFMMEDSEITITSGGKVYSIYSNDIGMSALPEETVQKAMSYCKSGNVFKDGFNAVKLLFSKHVISPSAQVDTEKLDEKLNEFGNIVLGERKQHDVQIGDNNVAVIYPGTTGYDGNPESARNAVLAALKDSDFSGIKVTFTSAPPDELTLDAFDSLVYKEPANAEYYVENNQVSIIRGQVGRYIDKNEAEPLLAKVHEGGEAVEVPFYDSMPDLTSDMLRERLFNDTIGTYSTSFAGSTENRCANVARAASLINGTVIPPGEVFSFNNTVGHRTVENGFFTAKEYVDGKSVDGIGGGTCQVSSTLYSAVLYADLSIVTRTNHMMAVSYMPLGQDATVVDGSIDFKFKNNTDSPIKISTSISGTNLTVNIIGTQWTPKREVKLSHTSSQSGKNTVVKSVRNVYANGELIATDTLPSSSYAPHETE